MRCNAKICKAYWENEAERLAKFVLRVKAAKELIRSDQGVAVFMGSMRIVAAQLQYPMPLFDSLATDVMQMMGRGDHKTLRESIDEGLIILSLRHIRYISRGESKCDQQALDELRACKLQKARIYDLLPKMEAYHLEFSAGLCIGSSLPEGEDANKKKFAFEKVERAIQPCFSLEAMVCKPNRKHFTEGYHGFKAGLMNTPTFYAKEKYSKYAAFEGRDWILGKITYGWVFPFELNRFPGRYAFTTDIGAGVPFMRSSKIDSLGGNVKHRGSFKYDGWGIAFNIGIRMMVWGRWVTLQRSIYGDGRNLPFYGQWNLAICWGGGKKMKLQY